MRRSSRRKCFICGVQHCAVSLCPAAVIERMRRLGRKGILQTHWSGGFGKDKLKDGIRDWVKIREAARKRVKRGSHPPGAIVAVQETRCPDCKTRNWTTTVFADNTTGWTCDHRNRCGLCEGRKVVGSTPEERAAQRLMGAKCPMCDGTGLLPPCGLELHEPPP